MKIVLKNENLKDTNADLVIVPVIEGKKNKAFDQADKIHEGTLKAIAKKENFKGQSGRSAIWVGESKTGPVRLIAVGVGSDGTNPAKWRQAIGRGLRYGIGHRVKSIAIFLDSARDKMEHARVQWTSQALQLAEYRFDKYKSKSNKMSLPKNSAINMYPPSKPGPKLKLALKKGTEAVSGVTLTRDLVNEPANILGPSELAARAKQVAQGGNLQCTIVDERALKRMGANLLLAVGAGSNDKPRLVHLVYKPKKKKKATVTLIGKGITFDSGGLCIKPGKSMATMKTDMGGAATVIGIMSTLESLAPQVEVHGIIPIAENSVGASAIRPGDVFKSLSGQTVEIINTDAEGRLILADAMTYAAKTKPDIMIDYATLTGACAVALGLQTAGLFSNSDKFAKQYLNAANEAGESLWRLPLLENLKGETRSSVADIKNVGGRYGGAITAALFLERFVGNTPWIHVDIAGPARAEKTTDLCPIGGSGFGVLTALDFLTNF